MSDEPGTAPEESRDDGGSGEAAGVRWVVVVTRPAARALSERLPEAVAVAAIEFVTGPLLDEPHRVGRRLRGDLAGVWSARRGTYRILYRIDDERREVVVLRVEHRADAYRRR